MSGCSDKHIFRSFESTSKIWIYKWINVILAHFCGKHFNIEKLHISALQINKWIQCYIQLLLWQVCFILCALMQQKNITRTTNTLDFILLPYIKKINSFTFLGFLLLFFSFHCTYDHLVCKVWYLALVQLLSFYQCERASCLVTK